MRTKEQFREEIKSMIEKGCTKADLFDLGRSYMNEYKNELQATLESEWLAWSNANKIHRPTLAELLHTIQLAQYIRIETTDTEVIYSGLHRDISYDCLRLRGSKLVVAQCVDDGTLIIYIEE